jgi:energy-coupling factor transporter ATP-binding protein EcfA2
MLHFMPNGTDALSALILAGPNGAGKTTFARALLGASSSTLTFLNADIIAAELSPGAPERVAMEAGFTSASGFFRCPALIGQSIVSQSVFGREGTTFPMTWCGAVSLLGQLISRTSTSTSSTTGRCTRIPGPHRVC